MSKVLSTAFIMQCASIYFLGFTFGCSFGYGGLSAQIGQIELLEVMPILTNFTETVDCPIDYTIRDGHGVLQQYNIAQQELLQLCGGIPSPDVQFVLGDITSITADTLTIAINTAIYQVFRTINFGLKRIFNDKMRVYEKEQYIGTSLFLNQVLAARRLGFLSLNTFALAHDGHEPWDGYYRWARLGYQMTDRNDLEDFADLMRFFSRAETTVGELVLSEEGYAFWKAQGFSWTGKFLLADGSKSMLHLRRYLELKKIDFIL